MKANTAPLEVEKIYHIYNRGVNGDNLFEKVSDTKLFLDKYLTYTKDVLETYCYCLLKNHFHFLVKIKPETEIRQVFHYKAEDDISKIVSQQFAHLFNSYARSFQNKYGRTGKLFESPFRRIWIDSEDYFTEIVYYIHKNPQKHGFTDDFKTYLYSSYDIYAHDISSDLLTKKTVLDWFGGLELLKKYHKDRQNKSTNENNAYTFEID